MRIGDARRVGASPGQAYEIKPQSKVTFKGLLAGTVHVSGQWYSCIAVESRPNAWFLSDPLEQELRRKEQLKIGNDRFLRGFE